MGASKPCFTKAKNQIMQRLSLLFFALLFMVACNSADKESSTLNQTAADSFASCSDGLPKRYGVGLDSLRIARGKAGHEGMVQIPAGKSTAAFWMDVHEVTNAQFRKFVEATGYITTAEKAPDWEELKEQMPPGTPRPHDSLLVAASLVFHSPGQVNGLSDPGQWWRWTKGASWKHPQGPKGDIKGRDDYPVVQVSWDDCMAYAKWAGKRLPTEAEWEFASRGGLADKPFPWGDEPIESGKPKANTWQGNFPLSNTNWDGFYGLAAVKQFKPNGYGLYDMAGNVWEWCSDWYTTGLQGSAPSEKVIRGGSFMCNDSYCQGYKVTSRMKSSRDTGLENTGFRCVSTN